MEWVFVIRTNKHDAITEILHYRVEFSLNQLKDDEII